MTLAATIRHALAAALVGGCSRAPPAAPPAGSLARPPGPVASAPPAPASLPADGIVSAVGYDASDDAVTLCPPQSAPDQRCARITRREAILVDWSASMAPAVRAKNLVLVHAPGASDERHLKHSGVRVIFDGTDRWVDLPALPRTSMPVQSVPKLLWISRDGSRALVWRTAAASASPTTMVLHLDVLDSVDAVAHRILARDESCGGFYGLGDLYVDADERALLIGMQQDTAEPWAIVDLWRRRFGLVRADSVAPAPQGRACIGYHLSGAWSDGHQPPGIVSADVTTLRLGSTVVALDSGRVTETVIGDFPTDIDSIEYVIDERTSVVVTPARAGRVYVGVLHRAPVASTTPPPRPPPSHEPPRSVPASGT